MLDVCFPKHFFSRIGATVALFATLTVGCTLGKRGDATDPLLETTRSRLNKLSSAIEPPNNLTRSSNSATLLRLQKLFPGATVPPENGDLVLFAPEFNTLHSTQLNRSFTAEGRPSSAIAQIGLRKWIARLCKDFSDGKADAAIFSEAGILMTGESLPDTAPRKLAFAAARNAWLAPYAADSPEVNTLLAGYGEALEVSGNDEAKARQTLCMAALLAPQFWIGNGIKTEPIRRAALEVGRTLPTFADYEAYLNGRLKLGDYVLRLQTDAKFQPGYFKTLRDWHQDWWGLRDYLNARESKYWPDGYQQSLQDPRADYWAGGTYGFNSLQAAISLNMKTLSDGFPLLDVTSMYSAHYSSMDYDEYCIAEKSGVPNVEQFDPRTTMIVFEHKKPVNGEVIYYERGSDIVADNLWEVVGGYVLVGRESEYTALVQAYDASFDFNARCKLHKDKYPPDDVNYYRHLEGFPEYWECGGSVTLQGGGFKPTEMEDFRPWAYQDNLGADKAARTNRYAPTWKAVPSDPSEVPKSNRLIGTVHETFSSGVDRRIRRKSPSGWQNGVSKMQSWYTGSTEYACNGMTRYFMSCVYRPPHGSWYNASAFPIDAGPGNGYIHDGAYFSKASAMNPHLLNQFRCGIPQTGSMPTSGAIASIAQTIQSQDTTFYPHGYSLANYTAALDPAQINDLHIWLSRHAGYQFVTPMYLKHEAPPGTPVQYPSPQAIDPEYAAIERVNQDLNNEPYYLLEHVLKNGLPYSEMFTANYTFGREELNLFYRTQGFAMPSYPPGYSRPAADAPSRTAIGKIARPALPALPSSWFIGTSDSPYYSYGDNDTYMYAYPIPTTPRIAREKGYLPPPPSSGVISMPAFLGPVSQKMRTISSRFFSRLLCGEPNAYVPQGGEIALHRQFIADPKNKATNATAALHLDETRGCYSCHINLDPLASALSRNFLPFVQVDEVNGMYGEFGLSGGGMHAYSVYILGMRNGDSAGNGAFLGKPASGVVAVGQILADSDMPYACATRRAFQEIYGRPPLIADAELVRATSKSFFNHKDFSRMIRELITNGSFGRDN